MHSIQLLTDPDQLPGNKLFEGILSEQLNQIYLQIETIISALGLTAEWHYYHDGKAWLCKITHKRKPSSGFLFGTIVSKPVFTLQKKHGKESCHLILTMILNHLLLRQIQSGN